MPLPKVGDKYECPACGMEMEVTKDCKCSFESLVILKCCNRSMVKQGEEEVLPEASPPPTVEEVPPVEVRMFRGKVVPTEE